MAAKEAHAGSLTNVHLRAAQHCAGCHRGVGQVHNAHQKQADCSQRIEHWIAGKHVRLA